MTTIRSSPSGQLRDTSLQPIPAQTVLANPEPVIDTPVPTSVSDVLDFVGDTPDHLLIRGAFAWETQTIDAIVLPSVARASQAAKFWLVADGATKALLAGHNIASTADGGVGVINVSLSVSFSASLYPILAGIGSASGSLVLSVTTTAITVNSFQGLCVVEAGSGQNPDTWSFAGFGSLA